MVRAAAHRDEPVPGMLEGVARLGLTGVPPDPDPTGRRAAAARTVATLVADVRALVSAAAVEPGHLVVRDADRSLAASPRQLPNAAAGVRARHADAALESALAMIERLVGRARIACGLLSALEYPLVAGEVDRVRRSAAEVERVVRLAQRL